MTAAAASGFAGLVWCSAEGPEGEGAAAFSPDRRHRYLLLRAWRTGPLLGFVGLNPSAADAQRLDPTLRRVAARARAAGYAGIAVANLYTLRSPDPAALRHAPDPTGPAAEAAFDALCCAGIGAVLCGWGNGGLRGGRGAAVRARLAAAGRPLRHLGLTAAGAPRHPLYVAATQPMLPWD